MKMAKANEADIDMALDLANALEDIERGCFPAKFNDPESDDIEWLVTNGSEQYQRLIDGLQRILAKGSLFRVVYGMAVVCDPSNELLDPEADTLEHHPIRQKLEAEREELLKALEKIACRSQTDGLLWWQTEARAAIAKASSESTEESAS